jgi:hypothetical protein
MWNYTFLTSAIKENEQLEPYFGRCTYGSHWIRYWLSKSLHDDKGEKLAPAWKLTRTVRSLASNFIHYLFPAFITSVARYCAE